MYVRWAMREIKSTRGRGSCRCAGFTYRESRAATLGAAKRAGGKVTHAYVARLGTIRSCCAVTRPEEALDAFVASCGAALRRLTAEGVLTDDEAKEILREVTDGTAELLPPSDADVRLVRAQRWRARSVRARRRSQGLLPRAVAEWTPRPGFVARRFDVGLDELEDQHVPAAAVWEQDAAFRAQLLTVDCRRAASLTGEQRRVAKRLLESRPGAKLPADLAGPLADLLDARSPEQFAEARQSLGAAAATIRQRVSAMKVHERVPADEREQAFLALATALDGMADVFGESLREDLNFWSKPRAVSFARHLALRAERGDESKLSPEERKDFEAAFAQMPDLPQSWSASNSQRKREAWREFHGLRRTTSTASMDAIGAIGDAIGVRTTPLDEAIARELNTKLSDAGHDPATLLASISAAVDTDLVRHLNERLTGDEAFIAVTYLRHAREGRSLNQEELGAIVYPDRTPAAAGRAVSRTIQRVAPVLLDVILSRTT